MCEEIDEEQLVAFCQRLGLAEDGCLDETGLSIVCKCIGLDAPKETMNELFEELDSDKDGKVCLSELSQMLKGMQGNKVPSSPEKLRLSESLRSQQASALNDNHELCDIPISDQGPFAVLDLNHTGFTKVGNILDFWGQLGIKEEIGSIVLKDLGFSVTLRDNSINLQDLSRSMEYEVDLAKDIGLPKLVSVALLTYRTEAQYLRSICESLECEREKLKSDILDVHERSNLLAQEVDEQNSRMEQNTKVLIQKVEAKYLEQIHEQQKRTISEKEYMQQTIQRLESQITVLRDEETKLKVTISESNLENKNLEQELQKLIKENKTVISFNVQLNREIAKYADLETKLRELERRKVEEANKAKENLKTSLIEIQSLRDQNDELTTQIDIMRETIHTLKSSQGIHAKRRKGSYRGCNSSHRHHAETSSLPFEEIVTKYNENALSSIEISQDDADTSMEYSSSQPDSGSFIASNTITIVASVGESSTDPSSLPQKANFELNYLGCRKSDAFTQTELNLEDFNSKISALEVELKEAKTNFAAEEDNFQSKCRNLEESLELLQREYEKCEEYWQQKIREERENYEEDRDKMDEKLNDLLLKIQEYEELFLNQPESKLERLSPIEESASLEKQVTDLEEECTELREALTILKTEHETELESYRMKFESKAIEDSALEQEIMALSKKCEDYEIRLSTLAEQERSPSNRSTNTLDTFLQNRVTQLEATLQEENEKHRQHVQDLDKLWKEKEAKLKASISELSQNSLQASFPAKLEQTDLLRLLKPGPGDRPSDISFSPRTKRFSGYMDKSSSLPYISDSGPGFNLNPWETVSPNASDQNSYNWFQPNFSTGKKAWCHVEFSWLQGLRTKLKQKEQQCFHLQQTLQHHQKHCEKVIAELNYQHKAEISNWENLMQASQELVRQQAIKYKEQSEKLAHADLLVKDLWLENAKLLGALNATEQRVLHLENLLKFQASSNPSTTSLVNFPTHNSGIPLPFTQTSQSLNYFP